MSDSFSQNVQVLVQTLEPEERAAKHKMKTEQFDAYRLIRTRTGKSSLRRLPNSQRAKNPHEKTLTLQAYRFTTLRDLPKAKRLIKRYGEARQTMFAIVSPAAYNKLDFRTALNNAYVTVWVGDQNAFKAAELGPLLAEQIQPTAGKTLLSDTSIPDRPASEAPALRDPASGRLDARKLIELFPVSLTDLAVKVCGISKQALQQNPCGAAIQKKLTPLEEIAERLSAYGGDVSKFRKWLLRPNRDFAAINGKPPAPLDLILLGHAEIVADRVHNLRTGHPA